MGLAGTPYAPDYVGAVLVLEDVGEAAYRVDRMVTTLALGGALSSLAAVVLGDFDGAIPLEDEADFWLRRSGLPSGIPVLAGAPVGHTRDQLVLPIRALVEVGADAGTLSTVHG